MKRTIRIIIISCLAVTGPPTRASAQDASHMETAKAEENSDWGLLGLIGLLGLLGLKRKDRTDVTAERQR